MNIDYDKIRNLLERVTSGNAGEVYISFYPERETCTITWKRPINMINYESCRVKQEMLRYVEKLLVDVGVSVDISIESTLGAYIPEA